MRRCSRMRRGACEAAPCWSTAPMAAHAARRWPHRAFQVHLNLQESVAPSGTVEGFACVFLHPSWRKTGDQLSQALQCTQRTCCMSHCIPKAAHSPKRTSALHPARTLEQRSEQAKDRDAQGNMYMYPTPQTTHTHDHDKTQHAALACHHTEHGTNTIAMRRLSPGKAKTHTSPC